MGDVEINEEVERRTDELLKEFLEYLENAKSRAMNDSDALFQQWTMQKIAGIQLALKSIIEDKWPQCNFDE